MKKIQKFLFVSLLMLGIFAPKSFALLCENSQALNGPDNCYTKVTLSSTETNLVSNGTVLIYDLSTTGKQGSYQVKVSTASADTPFVAGIAQGPIASGNSALILVNGFGDVKTTGNATIGAQLYTAASGNAGTIFASASVDAIGVSLNNCTGNPSTCKALVRILH